MTYLTPLRYPGGKSKISNYVKLILKRNGIIDAHYAEPYAGGAGIALSLLFDEYASHIHINDLDPAIYAFWHSAIHNSANFCRLIEETEVTMDEWYKQKQVQEKQDQYSMLELGFSTFFLNRTNRSGIISAGVIGGKEQAGNWKLDVRFNKVDLIDRIKKIALFRRRINLYNEDALDLLTGNFSELGRHSLVYLDPPYYVKGQDLYKNFYVHEDHVKIAEAVREIENPWIVSYDNTSQITEMYHGFRSLEYSLSYSAGEKYQGTEIIFFSNDLRIPDIQSPTSVTTKMLSVNQRFLAFE